MKVVLTGATAATSSGSRPAGFVYFAEVLLLD
jgi:hypothetical protein